MVKWGFGASVRVEIILRGADRSVLARNIESAALRPCQVAREAEISKKYRKVQKINKSRKSRIPSPLLLSALGLGPMYFPPRDPIPRGNPLLRSGVELSTSV